MKKNTSSVYFVGAKSSGRVGLTATVSVISKTMPDHKDLKIPFSEASIRVLS